MEEIIANKYTSALIQSYNNDTLKELYELLKEASKAFSLEKCRNIIYSPYIAKEQKKEFILSLLNDDKRLVGFVSILVQNDRIDMLPFIASALGKHLQDLDKTYGATLYSIKNLDNASINAIRENLSKKLGVDLHIEQASSKIDGIRLVVSDLGVEISFLREKFFRDLSTHILRSI